MDVPQVILAEAVSGNTETRKLRTEALGITAASFAAFESYNVQLTSKNTAERSLSRRRLEEGQTATRD